MFALYIGMVTILLFITISCIRFGVGWTAPVMRNTGNALMANLT